MLFFKKWKKPSAVDHTCNLVTLEAEAGLSIKKIQRAGEFQKQYVLDKILKITFLIKTTTR